MNYNNELYQQITQLSEKDFPKFSLQNMLPLTRFKSELLLDRLNDKTNSNEGKKIFDKFFLEEIKKIKDIQNTSLSRIIDTVSISNGLEILSYFSNLKQEYSPDEVIKSTLQNVEYHLSLNIMKAFYEDKHNIKKIDYYLSNEEIPENIVHNLIDNVSQRIDISSSYDEQIIALNFIYHNNILLNQEKMQCLIKNDENMKEWLDIFIDKEELLYQKKIGIHEQHDIELNNSWVKLDTLVQNLNQHSNENYYDLLMKTLDYKIHKIDDIDSGQSQTHSKYFYILMDNMKDSLQERKDFLSKIKYKVEVKQCLLGMDDNEINNNELGKIDNPHKKIKPK